MNVVFCIDLISLVAICAVAILFAIHCRRIIHRDTAWIVAALLFLLLFHHTSNVLEWSGVTSALDPAEDFTGILEPLFWGFLFYSFIQGAIRRNLEEREEKYRLLAENVTDVIYTLDLNGTITYASPSIERWLGLRPDEVVGKSLFDSILTPESTKKVREVIADEINREKEIELDLNRSITVEVQVNSIDGALIWAEVSASFIRDEAGAPTGILAVSRNITERREAEQTLRESEEKFRRLVTGMGEGVIVVDTEETFIFANPAAERIFGVEPGALAGHSLSEFLEDEMQQFVYEQTSRRNLGKSSVYEVIIIRPDGEKRHLRVNATPNFDESGKFISSTGIIQDITEQKRTEAALRESEEKFASAFRSAPLYTIISTVEDGTFIEVNEKFSEVTGYSREEVIGKTSVDLGLFSQETRDAMKQEFLDKGCLRALEITIRTKTGSLIRASLNGEVITIAGKQRLLILGEDLTEKKRVEEERRQSEQRIRLHRECTPLGVIEWTSDFRVAEWNRAAERIFGYTRDEAVGRHGVELIIPEKAKEHVDQVWADLLLQQGGERSTNENFTKDGRIILCEWYNTPLVAQDGTVIGVASTVMDITKRRQDEEALRRLGTAIAQAAEMFVITDAEGTIQYVNPAFEQITGYTKEEAIGKNPCVLKSGRQDAAFYDELWKTIANGEVWHGRFTNKKKDGTFYEEEASISPVKDEMGEIVNYVAVKRDVTREIALEQQLRQSQKLEAIGTLAGGIAHDFNNILFAILGNAEIALEAAPLDNRVSECLEQILTAGQRGADLIKRILDFARAKETRMKSLLLGPIVKEALKLMRSTLPANIEIKQNIEAPEARVMGDPTEIHQVLVNLCTNATYAMMETGGLLEVTLCEFEVDDEFAHAYSQLKPGPHILIKVSDTGEGMASDVLEHIFEPFYTTKEAGEGTGLGLSVAHGIVCNMGGVITAYSEPGIGSVFNVYIPEVRGQTDDEAVEQIVSLTGDERILLVEDEKAVAQVIERMLINLGYQVTSFQNSVEALDAFRESPEQYDLVITDLAMPKMTGDKLAKELLQIRNDLPIILCTGFISAPKTEEVDGIGIRAYLSKPISKHNLSETIRRALG